MVEAVIFDLGGVIVDWDNDTTYMHIADRYGIDFETVKTGLEEKIALVQTDSLDEDEWMAEFFRSVGMEPPEGYENIWRKTFENSDHREDVIELIKSIKENGYRLGILSNIEPSRGEYEIDSGLTDYFDVVIFSYDVGMRKTDDVEGDEIAENIFELVANELGVDPSDCFYIDDKEMCVRSSEDVGMYGHLFDDVDKLKKDLKKMGVKID